MVNNNLHVLKSRQNKLNEEQNVKNMEAQVLHFTNRKNHFHALFNSTVMQLVQYGKMNFGTMKNKAFVRFSSNMTVEIEAKECEQLFWDWYIHDYRLFKGFCPIVDFYLDDNESTLNEEELQLIQALKQSFLSVYQVLWVQNNTACIEDIFTQQQHIVHKDLSPGNPFITGQLFMARVIVWDHMTYMESKPVFIEPSSKYYLVEEVLFQKVLDGHSCSATYLKEYAEVLVGLVFNLTRNQKKMSVKTWTLRLNQNDSQALFNLIRGKKKQFPLLELGTHYKKFTWSGQDNYFRYLYVLDQGLVVAAENGYDFHDLRASVDKLRSQMHLAAGEWEEGCQLAGEAASEGIMLEIMHDKCIEEWFHTPLPELKNLSPREAYWNPRGMYLLDRLLDRMEEAEERAKNQGDYYFSTALIHNKLKLDTGKTKKREKAQAINSIGHRVHSYRAIQELSPYLTSYNWAGERPIAVANLLYDQYEKNSLDLHRLAWLLYMWNEYSTLYKPKVLKVSNWAAALEQWLQVLEGETAQTCDWLQKHGLDNWIINKQVQLLIHHFQQYPLDLRLKTAEICDWDDMNYPEMITAYKESQQYLNNYSAAILNTRPEEWQKAYQAFLRGVNTKASYWDKKTEATYKKYFEEYFIFDWTVTKDSTIANLFWDEQARRFPPHLKEAVFQVMMSYIGAYKVSAGDYNVLYFQDMFTGRKYRVRGQYVHSMIRSFSPNMVVLTRALPLGQDLWLNDPFYIMLSDYQEYFEHNMLQYMEKMYPYDQSDPIFLKQRGELILKAYLQALSDMETHTLSLLREPLHIDWLQAKTSEAGVIAEYFNIHKKFFLLQKKGGRKSYLWISPGNNVYHWGYVLLDKEQMLVFTPPGKEQARIINEIRGIMKQSGILLGFQEMGVSDPCRNRLEQTLITDLAGFFRQKPQLSEYLLTPDRLEDENVEYEQGLFMLKLGTRLMQNIPEPIY